MRGLEYLDKTISTFR